MVGLVQIAIALGATTSCATTSRLRSLTYLSTLISLSMGFSVSLAFFLFFSAAAL
jgi:hypothetical protein